MRKMLLLRLTVAKVAMVLAVVPVAVGCECIFRADFNADLVDSPPDTTLPGNPPGDSLALNTSAGDIRVRASVDDLTDQPVELRVWEIRSTATAAGDLADHSVQAKMSGPKGGVGLYGRVAGTPPTTGKWVANWRGLVTFDRSYHPDGAMVFRDSGGLILAEVEYYYERIYFNDLSDIDVTYERGVSQLFMVTIDLDARTVSLSVDGVAVGSCQNLNFANPAASDLAQMNFEVHGSGPQGFALDALSICAVPQED